MCVSDVTEVLGQFVEIKVVCCIFVGKKKSLCLQTRPVISDITVPEMLQGAVCVRVWKVKQSEQL